MRRRVRPGVFAVVAALTLARPARAHEFRPAVLTITVAAGGDVEVVLVPSLDVRGQEVALAPRLPGPCAVTESPRAGAGPRVWRGSCGPDGLRGRLELEGLAAAGVDAVVEVRHEDGRSEVAVLRGRDPIWSFGQVSGAAAFFGLGVEHIAFGLDHLLFVAGLVLLVLRPDRAGEADVAGAPVRRWLVVLGTLTAFTAAHSLTLAAATLGLVRVPQAPVEACIALSIALLARELVLPPRAGTPWGLAFGCGLLHGLGFAGALAEVGLPAGAIVPALLAFNLGVEAGQAAFAALLAALVVALVRGAPRRAAWVTFGTGHALGATAMAWTWGRIAAFWGG